VVGRLVRTLISNAIKYTSQGAVDVHCHGVGGKCRIEVSDSGVGIATDQIPLIFDEFYQIGVSPNSSRDGYGLGLSIVRRIVKLLDIPIHVVSAPGKGSVFSIELPEASAIPVSLPATPEASMAADEAGSVEYSGAGSYIDGNIIDGNFKISRRFFFYFFSHDLYFTQRPQR
jgi:hypothetical protein